MQHTEILSVCLPSWTLSLVSEMETLPSGCSCIIFT